MNHRLKVLITASAFMLFAGGLFGPLYAVFVEDIGGNLLTAGSAYGVFAVSAGILIYIISQLEERSSNIGLFVAAGYLLSTIGSAGYLLVHSPWQLFLIEIIFGLGAAVGAPAYDALYSSFLDSGKYVSQWGLWESMNWIVAGISAVLGGFVATAWGFNTLFTIMAILSFFGFINSMRLVSLR